VFSIVSGVFFSFIGSSKIELLSKIKLNGFLILIYCFLSISVLFYLNAVYNQVPINSKTFFAYLTQPVLSIAFLAFISLSFVSLGQLTIPKSYTNIIKLGFGMMGIMFIMFFLGALKMMKPYLVLLVLLIPILANYKNLLSYVKQIFLTPIFKSKLNLLGGVSLSFLILGLIINFLSIQVPMPVGFDSRNLYMNITQLVAESNGLIFGHRPYFYELLMSLPLVLNLGVPVSLSVSYLGIIFSLIIFHYILDKQYKVEINLALLFLFLLSATPALVNEMSIELKTNLGFLFLQLISVSLLIKLTRSKEFKSYFIKSENKYSIKSLIPILVLLGLSLGFGLGIKMTNAFLLFSVFIIIPWLKGNLFEFLSLLAFSVFFFLLLGLDDLSGLGKLHLSKFQVQVFLLVISSVCAFFGLFSHKISFVRSILLIGLIGVFAALPLSPWMVKNYIETGSLNPSKVINGALTGPDLNIKNFLD